MNKEKKMKFKKWIVENKYGIPQMKIWSKETPIENEENPATCHIDKETSTIEFIKPMLIKFLKEIRYSLSFLTNLKYCRVTVGGNSF